LLADEPLVRAILEAVVAAVDVPVTLKIRTGPDPRNRNGVTIAKIAEDAGIQALAVHGRTRADRFRGSAEYATISAICAAVDIPVFANGDLVSPEQAAEVMRLTGAQGLMFGRSAQGNPWIFREVQHFLETGRHLNPPDPMEVHAVMQEHVRGLHAFYGEPQGVRVARKHFGWYLQDRPGGQSLRNRLVCVESAAEQLGLLEEYFQQAAMYAA
jgi:tRNA-dihydrouridine synthase B